MNIALVAHDNCKKDLVRWAREHVNELKGHRLTCTGTTGRLIDAALRELLGDESPSTPVECLKSGPLGGDQQMGSRIAEGKIDALLGLLEHYGVIELVRSGAVAVTRGPRALSEKVVGSEVTGR